MISKLIPFYRSYRSQITRKAKKSIYNISDMRRRFLSSDTIEDEVKLCISGVSVLLVKKKVQSFNDKVLRIKGDEVRLPKDLFAGKWSDTLQSGSVQVFKKKKKSATKQTKKKSQVAQAHNARSYINFFCPHRVLAQMAKTRGSSPEVPA